MEEIYIDKVLSGDVDAFTYFIKTYKNMAFNIALSIVKDEQYAEEVTQDAFMKAFHGLKAFKRTAKFKSWFYRIVVNEAFLRLRSLKKNQTLISVDEDDDTILHEHFEPISEDYNDKIQQVLSRLNTKESLVLELFYLQELDIDTIMDVTGWTRANVKVILHRARKNTRKIWKETT